MDNVGQQQMVPSIALAFHSSHRMEESERPREEVDFFLSFVRFSSQLVKKKEKKLGRQAGMQLLCLCGDELRCVCWLALHILPRLSPNAKGASGLSRAPELSRFRATRIIRGVAKSRVR